MNVIFRNMQITELIRCVPSKEVFEEIRYIMNNKKQTHLVTYLMTQIIDYCVTSVYFKKYHIEIFIKYYNTSLDIYFKNPLSKFRCELFEKLLLVGYYGTNLFKSYYSQGFNTCFINNYSNLVKCHKNFLTITDKNIALAVTSGDILYDEIKEYYKNNQCTHTELYLMIIRL